MDDSEGKPSSDGVPKWQLSAPDDETTADAPQSQEDTQEDKLEVARRFLEDDAVKTAPRHTKVDFLKSKGVGDDDIEYLLGGSEEASSAAKDAAPTDESNQKALQVLERSFAPKPPAVPDSPAPILAGGDRPPVVTYPEFLTKPQRDPPLVTTNGLLNTLYAFGGLSTFLYAASRYAVEPMVEKLTSARIDLHETTSKKLEAILTQLESTVSVVPSYKNSGANATSETNDTEDPSEMFHRDVGTQTSFPTSSSSQGKDEAQSKIQADRLAKLAKSLKGLTDDFKKQSNESQDIKVLLDVFSDELDNMTYGHHADLYGGFDFNKKKKKSDSEDEIRKVRDNIRRIKGVLLSARTFPTSAR
ncbi:peroxin 14 17 [Trichoderma arundinaceum]|uniref:Peroxisomal membrane protein PEX14 n=1 Tax=Trichoderma arundinaceum TaxID=490622 RepID=A0A395NUY3_TRIAR|nr:peroxin 14 17 [Trichoderma arundinaceum]